MQPLNGLGTEILGYDPQVTNSLLVKPNIPYHISAQTLQEKRTKLARGVITCEPPGLEPVLLWLCVGEMAGELPADCPVVSEVGILLRDTQHSQLLHSTLHGLIANTFFI